MVGFLPLLQRLENEQKRGNPKNIGQKKAPTNLEIGAAFGGTFFHIKARQKIAVDPNFRFSKKRKIKWALKNPYNILAKYYELSSDSYFANVEISYQLDVVFIDGLHTYQQSLEDVNNSLSNLKENGVIVMHDCNPPNEAAAYPADSYNHATSLNSPGWTGIWCGDVWKTICYLRNSKKDHRIFVLNCDYGLGIITRRETDNCSNLSEQDLNKMTYDELSQNRNNLLNLKDEIFLFEFLKTI